MFRTVRHWWDRGHGRKTARLFAFELFVVILGVLIAQGVASWVSRQNDAAQGRELLASARQTAREVRQTYNFWERHGACVRKHVDEVAKQAATGGTMTREEIGRAYMPLPGQRAFSAEDWQKMRLVADAETIRSLQSLVADPELIRTYNLDVTTTWLDLRLLDGSLDTPSAEDRSKVRQAALRIDDRLRWFMLGNGDWRGVFRTLHLENERGLLGNPGAFTECGLQKNWY